MALIQDDPDRLHAEDWYVADAPRTAAKLMVQKYHYAKGVGSITIFTHGLFRKSDNRLMGVAVWQLTTRVASESVDKENWRRVLALSRLVCLPDAPRNAATFLMAASIKLVWEDGYWTSLVTYADESQGHTGAIYKATNWTAAGRTKPEARYLDPARGNRMVSRRGAYPHTRARMEELGYVYSGQSCKHKFVLHMPKKYVKLHKQEHDKVTNSLFDD